MFGLSSSPDYIEYMTLKTKGDIQGSISALVKCIELAKFRVDTDPSELSFLTQELGSLRYINGEENLAFDLYNQSLDIDKGSLLAVLLYAKFLANECQLFQDAILKCNIIIDVATTSPFLESDNDFGSDYYLRNAVELKKECLEQLNFVKKSY